MRHNCVIMEENGKWIAIRRVRGSNIIAIGANMTVNCGIVIDVLKKATKGQQNNCSDKESKEEYTGSDCHFNQCSPVHSGILDSIAQLTQ